MDDSDDDDEEEEDEADGDSNGKLPLYHGYPLRFR
jgi:hypothetical protein